ncbi:MAG TPA: hypothetical protein VIS48_13065 [Candidatus Kryptonia bacterium]
MKNLFRVITVALSMLFVWINPLVGQWIRINKVEYGLKLVCGGSNLFVVNPWNGIIRSTDWGSSWSAVGISGEDLAVAGSYVFAASPSGVYVSTDQGKTWTISKSGLGTQPGRLVIKPELAGGFKTGALADSANPPSEFSSLSLF